MKKAILLSVCSLLFVFGTAMAHEGHKDHKIMGTVKSVDQNHVVVTTEEGDMSVAFTPKTTFQKGKTKSDIKGGEKIVVMCETGTDGKMMAVDVLLPNIVEDQTKNSGQKYTCSMHPEVVKDQPGKCPKCEMTLVPVKPTGKKSSTDHTNH